MVRRLPRWSGSSPSPASGSPASAAACATARGPHQYTQDQHRRRARRLLRHGIEALHDVLEQLSPSWHLHGHIHPFGRPRPDRQVGATTVRNVVPWAVLEVESQQWTPTVATR